MTTGETNTLLEQQTGLRQRRAQLEAAVAGLKQVCARSIACASLARYLIVCFRRHGLYGKSLCLHVCCMVHVMWVHCVLCMLCSESMCLHVFVHASNSQVVPSSLLILIWVYQLI